MFPYTHHSPATVQIGSLVISVQAAAIAATAMVSALVSLIVLHKYLPFASRMSIALSLLLGGFVAAYNVNCTVVGHCNVWAWFLTVIFIFNTVMITASHAAEFKKLYKELKKSVKK